MDLNYLDNTRVCFAFENRALFSFYDTVVISDSVYSLQTVVCDLAGWRAPRWNRGPLLPAPQSVYVSRKSLQFLPRLTAIAALISRQRRNWPSRRTEMCLAALHPAPWCGATWRPLASLATSPRPRRVAANARWQASQRAT